MMMPTNMNNHGAPHSATPSSGNSDTTLFYHHQYNHDNDDVVIAIQEKPSYEHCLPQSYFLTHHTTQPPSSSNTPAPPRRRRRRPAASIVAFAPTTTTTTTTTAASQEATWEYQNQYAHNNNNNTGTTEGRALDEDDDDSNAFASLQFFLEQQQLSLSMTQGDDDEEEDQDKDGSMEHNATNQTVNNEAMQIDEHGHSNVRQQEEFDTARTLIHHDDGTEQRNSKECSANTIIAGKENARVENKSQQESNNNRTNNHASNYMERIKKLQRERERHDKNTLSKTAPSRGGGGIGGVHRHDDSNETRGRETSSADGPTTSNGNLETESTSLQNDGHRDEDEEQNISRRRYNHDIRTMMSNASLQEDAHKIRSTAINNHRDDQLKERQLVRQGRLQKDRNNQHQSKRMPMPHSMMTGRLDPKERHDHRLARTKKTSRSKSADQILFQDDRSIRRPSKHSKKVRSVSPKEKRSISPKRTSSRRSRQPIIPVEPTKKSLVGFRPSHWGNEQKKPSVGGPKKSVLSDSYHNHSHRQQDRQRRQLAAACNSSSVLMPPPAARRCTGGRSTIVSPGPGVTHSINSNNTTASAAAVPDIAANVSFKPDFLPANHDSTTHATIHDEWNSIPDAMEMEIDGFDNTQSMPKGDTSGSGEHNNSNSPAPTTGGRKTSFLATVRASNTSKSMSNHQRRMTLGSNNNNLNPDYCQEQEQHHREEKSSLVQLFQEAKSEIRINGTRFRSGEYPFPNNLTTSRFDLYDPRRRARSYMDVTLLGESSVLCKSVAQPHRGRQQLHQNDYAANNSNNATILGYIHEHHIFTDRDILAGEQVCAGGTGGGGGGGLAWICFSGETVQEHYNLQKNGPRGYQLRIYNAVVVPTVVEDDADAAAENENENNGATTASSEVVRKDCRYMVLCSQLCEPYPTDILGPLRPSLSELLGAGSSKNDDAMQT